MASNTPRPLPESGAYIPLSAERHNDAPQIHLLILIPPNPPRARYERNKHIFPASRWEVYDPAVERGTYTIHGGEVNAEE